MHLKQVNQNLLKPAKLSKWVLEHFPEDYKDYIYLEPYFGESMLHYKEPSSLEAINDTDLLSVQIMRACRDEPKEFIKRLKKIKQTEETFKKAIKKTDFEDYLDIAINEFVKRNMSRGGLKKTYHEGTRWKTAIAEIEKGHNRLKDVHIFNNNPLDLIKMFNSKTTITFCNPPLTENHANLSIVLDNSLGKVILLCKTGTYQRKNYAGWNLFRFKRGSDDVILKNF